jgi:hypothetical protein
VAVLAFSGEDVSGQSREAAGNGPNVQVMDLLDALHAHHTPADFPTSRPRGACSSKMFVESLRSFQELPRTRKATTTLMIGSAGYQPVSKDDDGGGDHADGTGEVGQDAPQSALEVEALALRAGEEKRARRPR